MHGPIPLGETRLEITRQILKVIEAEHLPPVTGFVNAVGLVDEPTGSAGVLEAWRDAGQPLANHTYTHMPLDTNTVASFEADIEKNEPTLEKMAAYPPGHPQQQSWKYLRYPYLQEGDTPEKRVAVRAWLDEHGYQVAEVSLQFGDYLWNEPYARCAAKNDQAAIKHLRDTYLAAAREQFASQREKTRVVFGHEIPYVLLLHIGAFDARIFPELVAQMKAEGFGFVTLPEAESDPAYSTSAAQMSGGGTFEDQVKSHKGGAPQKRTDYTGELDALCR